MCHARKGGTHVVERLRERGAAARGLLGVAVLQQLDHDIVELDEANVQALRAAAQIRDAHRARIDPAHARLDLLIRQQRVVDSLTVEVAVAHDLGSTEDFGIEGEGAVHVLHGEPEMLHALEPGAERPVFRGEPLTGRASCAAAGAAAIEAANPPIAAIPAAWRTRRRSRSASCECCWLLMIP
jgi:hypothetical protein